MKLFPGSRKEKKTSIFEKNKKIGEPGCFGSPICNRAASLEKIRLLSKF
jgi:hypothetical protein